MFLLAFFISIYFVAVKTETSRRRQETHLTFVGCVLSSPRSVGGHPNNSPQINPLKRGLRLIFQVVGLAFLRFAAFSPAV